MSTYPQLNEWVERYEIELVRHRENNPDRYMWGDEKLQEVVDKMRQGFARGPGHFNKDSHTIRATCKHFGIPPTYSAIDRFIRGLK